MILLAIDTAGGDCSAAVYDGVAGVALSEITDAIGIGHAEKLMAVIDRALDEAGLSIDAIERIAVTIGPGSFTGIRVGVAAARGLALALGVEAVGVSTLAVLAASAADGTKSPLLAAMDAKRGEIYAQLYAADGTAISPPEALSIDAAKALVADTNATIVGSAAALLSGLEGEKKADRFPIGLVARLGAAATPSGRPKPLYLRGPDAKVQTGFAIARM